MSSSTEKTWKDVTLGDMAKIRSIADLQIATEDEKNVKLASLIYRIPEEELMNAPLSRVREMMDGLEFLRTTPVPEKARRTYVVNGRTYKLLRDGSEMTVSQFIDFQAVQEDGFDKRPGELLAVMMVPKGHEYNDGYDKGRVVEDMYSLSVPEALGICGFFTRRFRKSTTWTVMCLKAMMRVRRMLAPRETKAMWRALEAEMSLFQDAVNSMFG